MRLILKFDGFLIMLFERFARWFQRWTGLTNAFLASATLAVYVVLLMQGIMIAYDFRPRASVGFLIKAAIFLTWIRFTNKTFKKLAREDWHAVRRQMDNVANWRKADPQMVMVRVYLFFVSWLACGAAYSSRKMENLSSIPYCAGCMAAITIAVYFLSCDPLPPSVGRIRAMFRGWGKKPAQQEVENTESVTLP